MDEALPSVKSDSTKENKSMKLYGSNAIKDHSKTVNQMKSSLSREKYNTFAINVGHSECPGSELRPREKKKLKKRKSQNSINLIERAKKRD